MTEKTKTMQWFRLYHELLRDRKIARAARSCNVDRATVIGVWTGIMCLANESPERGSLFIAPNVPLTPDDLPDEIGIDPEACMALLIAFQDLDMLSLADGVISVTHFHARQYQSDNSTERTREYRERCKKQAEQQDSDTTAADAETSQERHKNVPVTDQRHSRYRDIADTETEVAATPPAREPTKQQAMVGALCKVCVVDAKLAGARMGKTAKKLLDAGYTSDDVALWYSPSGWWYKHDWRGKRGEAPKPEQVAETIAQAKQGQAQPKAPAATKHVTMINPFTNEREGMEIRT